jgi:hypothetical protein
MLEVSGAVAKKRGKLHIANAIEFTENIILKAIEQTGPPPAQAQIAALLP